MSLKLTTVFHPVREGVYLFKHGIDPYSGGVFRQVGALHLDCNLAPDARLVTSTSVTIFYNISIISYIVPFVMDIV